MAIEMKAERLIPLTEPIITPQCEAKRLTPYANDTGETDFQCKWSSRYKIEGQYLCTKHAGAKALEILLRE